MRLRTCLITPSHNFLCSVYTVTLVRWTSESDQTQTKRQGQSDDAVLRQSLSLKPLIHTTHLTVSVVILYSILDILHITAATFTSALLQKCLKKFFIQSEKKQLRLSSFHSSHMSEDRHGVSWPKDSIRAFKPRTGLRSGQDRWFSSRLNF